jgi:hypothetical protein
MTPDERTLLTQFLRDLDAARAGQKDAEAEAMIGQVFARNPDAAYLLVQHTILSDQALQQAQARIQGLEAQLSGQGVAGSFLGGARPQPATAVPTSAPAYASAPPPAASPFSSGGGLGSFLRNAGAMAAGVAAGDLLFDGLSGLFGGHRGFGGFGGLGGFGGFGGAPVENVTINEYDDRGGGWDDPGQGGGFDDGGSWDNS